MRSPSLYFLCSLVYVTSHPPFAFKLLNANNYLPPPLPPSFTPHHVLPRELKLLCSSLLLTPHPPSSIYGNWIPDSSCYIWDRGLRFLGVALKRILSHESGIEGLVCLGKPKPGLIHRTIIVLGRNETPWASVQKGIFQSLKVVEEFEGISQATEHSYPALVMSSEDGTGGTKAEYEGYNSEDYSEDEMYNDDDDDEYLVNESLEEMESPVPLGSLPVDLLAKQLGEE
ncbi:hypothetical protein AAG906_040952 [Vitis piasezkii]